MKIYVHDSAPSSTIVPVTETQLTPEYAAAHAGVPASEPSGGDFVSTFRLGNGTGDVAVVMGDVAGHGPEQTAQAEHMRDLLSDCLEGGMSPAQTLTAVNAIIEPDPNFEAFGTVFAGVLEGATGKLTYASGGHEPALIAAALGAADTIQELAAAGPPVGAFPEELVEFKQDEALVPDGGTLLLYTDGLSDVSPTQRRTEWLGSEGLKQIVAGLSKLSPGRLVSALFRHVSSFCRGRFSDDVSVIAVQRHQGRR